MSDSIFVDTNILLYARDASEPTKQAIASRRLDELWDTRTGRLSVQVLNEYFVNVTHKLNPGLSPEEAWDDIEALTAWEPLALDMAILNRSYATQCRFHLSWWDSLIVASAEAIGCARILSEDLSDGADYFGITVENPFKSFT
ncbi:MAG: PIN domain-containing protein [Verrucomicrobiales bacterium]